MIRPKRIHRTSVAILLRPIVAPGRNGHYPPTSVPSGQLSELTMKPPRLDNLLLHQPPNMRVAIHFVDLLAVLAGEQSPPLILLDLRHLLRALEHLDRESLRDDQDAVAVPENEVARVDGHPPGHVAGQPNGNLAVDESAPPPTER